VTMLV